MTNTSQLDDEFPHTQPDCSGNLVLETTGDWTGSEYIHRWYCPECDTVAAEVFTPAGFEQLDQ